MKVKKWTLGEWLSEWYETYKKPYLRPNSVRNIEQVIRLHIPEDLKYKRLTEITAHEVEKALAPLGKSRTRVYTRQVLYSAFDKAFKLGFVKRNVMEAVENVRYQKQKSKALKIDEQREFLARLENSRYKWLMLFYLLTGVRRGEALTLRTEDINYVENLIYIRGTKTEESERYILLTPEVNAVLRAQLEQNERERREKKQGRFHQAEESIVFPFGLEQASREFKKLCPNHHLHELRHTFVTRCAESGVNVTVCQQLVGHSTADMTLNVYTHVMDEFKRKEAKKFQLFPTL